MFNSKYKSIRKKVLDEINLQKDVFEDIKLNVYSLLKRLKENNLNARIGGSFAKGTLIKKDDIDVDIFVQFDSEKAALRNLNPVMRQLNFELYLFELIQFRHTAHGPDIADAFRLTVVLITGQS